MITEKQLAELSVKGGPSYISTLRDKENGLDSRILTICKRIDSILIETKVLIDPVSTLIVRHDAVYELYPDQIDYVMKLEKSERDTLFDGYCNRTGCIDTYTGQYASTLVDSIELVPEVSARIFAILKLWLVKTLFENTDFDLHYLTLWDLYCDVQKVDPRDKTINRLSYSVNLPGLIHAFESRTGKRVRNRHTYLTTRYPFMLTDNVAPVIREILTECWGSNHIQNGNTYMITLLELTALYLIINLQQKTKNVQSRAWNYLLSLQIMREPFSRIKIRVFMDAGAYRNGGSLAIAQSSVCDRYKRLANAICMLLNNGIPCHLSLVDTDDTADDYVDAEEVSDDKAPPILTLVDTDK